MAQKKYDVTIGGVTKLVLVDETETPGEYLVTVNNTDYRGSVTELPDPEPEPDPDPEPEPEPDPEPESGDNSTDNSSETT